MGCRVVQTDRDRLSDELSKQRPRICSEMSVDVVFHLVAVPWQLEMRCAFILGRWTHERAHECVSIGGPGGGVDSWCGQMATRRRQAWT